MKNINFLLITALFLCLSACTSDSSSSKGGSDQSGANNVDQAQSEAITIGAFLRGMAPDEDAAMAFERGMDLAAEEKSPPSVNRSIRNRTDGDAESPALELLVTTSPLLVYWQTSDLAAAAPALKDAEVIGVPIWNVTKKVTSLGRNFFGFGYSTEKSFAQYAKFAGNKLKSYRFAVLASSEEPFSTQSKAFVEETKSQGNTIVFEEEVESGDADFSALVSRAAKENCDTIFAVLPGEALVSLIKAARAASFGGKILVGDSFFMAQLESLGADADGVYVLQAWSDDAALKAKYAERYGPNPDGVTLGTAALGYDLIKCIEAAGPGTSSSISHAWLSNPCEGLTGKTQFSGERISQRVKQVLTVKAGKFAVAG